MFFKPRFTLLAPLALLLTACGSDSPPAPQEQLQSITVKDANGVTTAFTALDYSQGSLVRVRGYNQPGEDGLVGTADDPLFNNTYADCRISTNKLSNNRINFGLLHDAYAEVHGSSPIAIFFRPFSDCALPGIKASSIANANYSSGLDGKWFTADDVKVAEFTLSRTATGSDLTSPTTPVNTSTNVNSTGLDHIVYNPYAGLNIHVPYTVSNTYGYDAAGRVKGLSQTGHQTLYELQSDGFIKTREINPSNGYALGVPGAMYLREEYEKTSTGKIRVRPSFLVPSDVWEPILASPTGLVLLETLGILPLNEKVSALDGKTYYFRVDEQPHYEIEKTGERIDCIKKITSPGTDTVWNTDDDVVGATVVFSYGITS